MLISQQLWLGLIAVVLIEASSGTATMLSHTKSAFQDLPCSARRQMIEQASEVEGVMDVEPALVLDGEPAEAIEPGGFAGLLNFESSGSLELFAQSLFATRA